ncbi:MAG TPA: immunoglobulin domain-containing protein, partial [Acidobacteriota bacterium]|nr:immunoglobulin domain-containing protein [Acidobacteriota bacterium]
LTQPATTLTAFANRAYSLEVTARGVAPLTYAWFKNNVALAEGANGITGTNTTKLVFANLSASDTGSYHVVVTNGSGSQASNTFTLAVAPHPADRATAFASVSGNNPTTLYALLPLADGGALVGGSFNSLNGAGGTLSGGRLARVLANGQVQAMPFTLNGDVYAIHRQPDGKFLVGGAFTLATPSGQSSLTRNRLLRLNADFSIDTTFDVGAGPTGSPIRALRVDAQGRIYAAGDFPAWTNRPTNNYLVRLLPSGAADPTFNSPFNNTLFDLELDSAGRVYVAGNFTSYQSASYLVRLLDDGSRDTAYSPASVSSQILDLQFQPDGKLLFLLNSGGVRRVNVDGTADAGFPTVNQSGITTLSLQADGQIVLGGSFTSYGGFARSGLVRLSGGGVVDPVLAIVGSAPTVYVVRVDAFGRIWIGGNFTVFNNDVTNVRSLYVLNGDAVPLGFAQMPASVSVEPGQVATFSAIATGTSAISYRWMKDGVTVAEGGRISGATTAQLTIADVQPADEGNYSLEITNAAGTRTSTGAELIVLGAPEILLAPGATNREVGQALTFNVSARGAGT